jgi:hypothetical protein
VAKWKYCYIVFDTYGDVGESLQERKLDSIYFPSFSVNYNWKQTYETLCIEIGRGGFKIECF